MRVEDYDYELSDELIAQHPPKERGTSRLLVLDRKNGAIEHKKYSDLADFVGAGDVVVLNNTKVIKARLVARNVMSKTRELFLLEKHGQDFGVHRHKVLYRGKIHAGEILRVEGFELTVTEVLGGGIAIIESEVDLLKLSEKYGSVPLPPYMKRTATAEDTERYQTVFANEPGSVAAPTASLNFTKELEAKLTAKGVKIAYLTLHVGLGTFLPIRVDDITKHKMHEEYFEIPAETIKTIKQAKQSGHKIIAVGTTVTRTLEYCAPQILPGSSGLDGMQEDNENRTSSTNSTTSEDRRQSTQQSAKNVGSATSSARWQADVTGRILAGEADIFIYPGYEFKVIDKLVTNFHAPRTTVLMLTAAFASWPHLKTAYDTATEQKYAFLSYGDSMLIQ